MINDLKFIEIQKKWEGNPSQLNLFTYILHQCNFHLMVHKTAWEIHPTQIAKELGINRKRCFENLDWLVEHEYIEMLPGEKYVKGNCSTKFVVRGDIITTKSGYTSYPNHDEITVQNVPSFEQSGYTSYPNDGHEQGTNCEKSGYKNSEIRVQNVPHINNNIILEDNIPDHSREELEEKHDRAVKWMEGELDKLCVPATYNKANTKILKALERTDVFTEKELEYFRNEHVRLSIASTYGLDKIERYPQIQELKITTTSPK